MPQTEGHGTSKHVELDVSTDGENWTSINCSSAAITPGGGEMGIGVAHTFCEVQPLLGPGRVSETTLGISIVYTEVPNESADLIDGFRVNQTEVWIRYRPFGSAAGAWEFIGRGYFTTPITPPADAGSDDLLMVDTSWTGTELAMGIQAT